MSNFTGYGTLTANGDGDAVQCSGFVTMTAHYQGAGTGTLKWQFKGPDGEWRDLYGGTDGETLQSFTGSHMINAYFADDTMVRANLSSASSADIDWQIFSNPRNRV